jgi:hypothetical protein
MPDMRFDGIIDVDSACAQADSPGPVRGHPESWKWLGIQAGRAIFARLE